MRGGVGRACTHGVWFAQVVSMLVGWLVGWWVARQVGCMCVSLVLVFELCLSTEWGMGWDGPNLQHMRLHKHALIIARDGRV